jgi:hypothetical protein
MVDEICQAEAIKQSQVYFSRKDVRKKCGWGLTQVRMHMERLEEHEYLVAHRGATGKTFIYELTFDGDLESNLSHLIGLIDIRDLENDPKIYRYDDNLTGLTNDLTGQNENMTGSKRGENGPKTGGVGVDKNTSDPVNYRLRRGLI